MKISSAIILLIGLIRPTSQNAIRTSLRQDVAQEAEDIRKDVVELPDALFDLELGLKRLLERENVTGLADEAELIRRIVAALPERLFELELKLNRPLTVDSCGTWHLAVNLNPGDGHIMDFTTGWTDGADIGSLEEAFLKDYLKLDTMELPADYIAIARHQQGVLDAVKVFKFKQWGRCLDSRFRDENPGRTVVTEGGPLQVSIAPGATNLEADPIFGLGGDLIFNHMNQGDNGHRIVMSEGYLPARNHDPSKNLPLWGDLARGLGNNFCWKSAQSDECYIALRHEVSNYQACRETCTFTSVQGGDHGPAGSLTETPIFGNYAIFVSSSTDVFPLPGTKLETVVKQC